MCGYTQQDITISEVNESGKYIPVCYRAWCGVAFDPEDYEDGEDADIITFGDFGHYTDWREEF